MVDIPAAFPLKPYTGHGREFLLLSSQPSPLLSLFKHGWKFQLLLFLHQTQLLISSLSPQPGAVCGTKTFSAAVLSGREREGDGSSATALVVATHCQLCQGGGWGKADRSCLALKIPHGIYALCAFDTLGWKEWWCFVLIFFLYPCLP